MTGFKAFRYYIALKLHFTTDKFNVFENRGNVKGSYETFQARNDRYIFDKLARKHSTDQELIQFLVANFAYGNDNMIYGIEEAEENLVEWTKRKQSITKVFNDDLNYLELEIQKNTLTLDQIINFTLNSYPYIIKLYLGKKITLAIMSILNDFLGIIPKWKENDSGMLILENDIRRIEKSKGFVKYEQDKIKPYFNEFISTF
jgi:hypothetical protein